MDRSRTGARALPVRSCHLGGRSAALSRTGFGDNQDDANVCILVSGLRPESKASFSRRMRVAAVRSLQVIAEVWCFPPRAARTSDVDSQRGSLPRDTEQSLVETLGCLGPQNSRQEFQ